MLCAQAAKRLGRHGVCVKNAWHASLKMGKIFASKTKS
jgi:hypothetical protein